MTATAWRIVDAKHKSKAFSGDGARRHGGRWNSKSVAVIYTAGSLALPSIELVVNLPSSKLLESFVRIPVLFKTNLLVSLSRGELPGDWQSRPISPTTKAIGDRWIRQQQCPILKVPSVVVPEEFNYLINPVHPDFTKIEIGHPAVYPFDPCLEK